MTTDDTTQLPQAQARLLVNQHGLISGVRFTKQTPDVVFGDPEVVRIKPSGEVVIAEGANLDDAALAFWHAITEWRSTASRPTLADAQPGGRVRLGDAPFVWSDRAKADALEAGQYAFTEADGKDLGYTACIEACVDAICSVLALPDHRAALSAQPSPGGQEDAITPAMIDAAIAAFFKGHAWSAIGDKQAVESKMRETLEAALAARQPVGQEPVTDAGRTAAYDAIDRFLRNNMDDEAYAEYVEHLEALWSAVPAQAVDLGQFRQPVQDWLDDAQASMEEHGDYDGVFGHAIEEGTRLLALIDSQAVGNG